MDVADIIHGLVPGGLQIGQITALRWQDLTPTTGYGAVGVTVTIVWARL